MSRPIKVLSGGAMQGLLAEVTPLFERASGVAVTAEFGLTSALKKTIEAGAAFDVALLPRPELDALVQQGRISAGSQTDITRSAIGVAVRAGAPKPEIATVEAFKRALRKAKSITYSDGPSGAYIGSLLERLGVAVEMKPKTKLTTGPVAELVAMGEAEIGLQQIVAILPIKGAELVGPLPDELQNTIVYAAGLGPRISDADAVRRFIDFLRSADVVRIIRQKGMEPG